jgi:hypothetical protein
VPRKGRARRFREARELKQGFDDGLFSESDKTLAELDETTGEDGSKWLEEEEGHGDDWDEDDPLKIDERRG